MGLGKTLQAISFLSYLKACRNIPGPFLVLCPLSVTDGWVSETASFAPKLRVLSYVGDKDHRRSLRKNIYDHVKAEGDVTSFPFDVLLTTYDIALMDQDFLSQFQWYYSIIDEAQRLKNPSSVLYNVLRENFVMPRRLLMTGTPIQNNLTELWALMHFCMPAIFGTREQFLSTFKEAGDPARGHDAQKVKEQFKILRYILGALMLRRTKYMLMESGSLVLPPLTEITLMAPLVVLQKKVYISILRKELPRLVAIASGTPSHQSLQNIVMQLRKACSHPYLFPGIEPEPYVEGEHLVQASGKLLILDQLLQKLHDSGHRVLLFAQMTHTLDILQDFLELRKYSYERLDGSIRAEERFAAIRSFSKLAAKGDPDFKAQDDKNDAFVFMISTRAGGVGLNLVAADTVIFYEQDWNPQVDKQALQRAHRIGQMNHVLSINLVTARTVEEVIMRRAERKLQLSHNVVGENVMDHEGKENMGGEVGDLRAVIFGLHKFDLTEMSDENSDLPSNIEMDAAVKKVLALRDGRKSDIDDKKLEIDPRGISDGHDLMPSSVTFDPGLDEASYLSWVQKFSDESRATNDPALELENRRRLPEEKLLKAEAARKKAEEKKLAKWEALGYKSLAVKDHINYADMDITSDSGNVIFVYGDCTQPSKVCPSQPTIIFRYFEFDHPSGLCCSSVGSLVDHPLGALLIIHCCVDDSGTWGHGGLFNALAKLSDSIPKAYERASEFDDLHLGDLHLLEITEDTDDESKKSCTPKWVALAVVQSYSPRRKVPRSNISMPDLELCLSKASSTAAEKLASIHMPRIGYQNASDRSEWYAVERILRKHAAMYGVKIYVYYFKHSASG
ncbi:putative helicase CHR10 isoform X1 [Apium graveolens]|uniref:putative helicase CHR10 isoform X1 n=1 Tax=Apium graveolens TaxID=4045 RepID=UPI003D7AFBEB